MFQHIYTQFWNESIRWPGIWGTTYKFLKCVLSHLKKNIILMIYKFLWVVKQFPTLNFQYYGWFKIYHISTTCIGTTILFFNPTRKSNYFMGSLNTRSSDPPKQLWRSKMRACRTASFEVSSTPIPEKNSN